MLLFHRLTEAITFAVHFEDLAMMGQTVQQRGSHAFTLEDLLPLAKGQVSGDQQTGAFVAIGEHLEKQFRAATTERQVT